MRLSCEKCGAEYDAKGAWQKLCWECWRSRENERAGRGDLTALANHATKLLNEAYEAGRQRGYDVGYAEASAAARPRRNGNDGAIDPALLRELIRLCHPDMHPPERFDTANRVTAQLNSIRDGR
jgi:hypothetical protein